MFLTVVHTKYGIRLIKIASRLAYINYSYLRLSLALPRLAEKGTPHCKNRKQKKARNEKKREKSAKKNN
jgi:hypothetical protein